MTDREGERAMPRRVTAADVGRAAGVSAATVSLVLNGKSEGRVTVATARRVHAAAQRLGYRIDRRGQSLATGRSGLIGFVAPDTANPFLGSVQMHDWLKLGQLQPVGLVQAWGVGPALAATLAGLAVIAVGVRLWVGPGKPLFEKRWVWGAIALAALATINLVIAGQPWGVVYGFGLWAAKGAQALGLFDPTQNAFWGDAGNARILAQSALLDVTSITNIGLLGGALWVSASKPANAKPLTATQWAIGLVAGFVLGYSSRLAFGCNVGAMFSGISTGSVHGWIWMPMAFLGTLIGLRVRRRFGF